MQGNVVLPEPTGSITIVKDDVENSGTDFTFTGDYTTTTPISTTFELDDGGPTDAVPTSQTWQALVSGKYYFYRPDCSE